MWQRIFPQLFSSGRSGGCPDEAQLAAFSEQQLVNSERQQIEQHLVTCDACVRQVAFLVRTSDAEPVQPPFDFLRRARALGRQNMTRSIPRWRWAVAGVAVAGVVFAVVWIQYPTSSRPSFPNKPAVVASTQVPNSQIPTGAEKSSEESQAVVRGSVPTGEGPALLFPTPGAVVAPGELGFRWAAVRGALSYEVRIVSAEGDLVWQSGKQHDTSVRPPRLSLRAGNSYYIWLRVHRADGVDVQLPAVQFIAGKSE